MRRPIKIQEAQKEQKARRENQVTLYRKYRIGDLPDIQIKYQYVIAPLQALANALCVTEWNDGDPLEAEVTLWNDNRMECVNNLCRWEDLETISVEGVDSAKTPNLDRVWEDEYYQEHFLPYVVRSKLKLLLRGADQQSLLSFIDSSMVNESTKQHLQSRIKRAAVTVCKYIQNVHSWAIVRLYFTKSG
ncbi:hypothetical protein BsWGS_06178 [Bradybaena similaris]